MQAISIATDSAHPVSRPSDFQPARNFQAAQRPLTRMPMPKSVEASTQMSISTVFRTSSERETLGRERISFHQRTSLRAEAERLWDTNSLGKSRICAAREGRKERPSRYTKLMCCNVPLIERTAGSLIFPEVAAERKRVTLPRYLRRFFSLR